MNVVASHPLSNKPDRAPVRRPVGTLAQTPRRDFTGSAGTTQKWVPSAGAGAAWNLSQVALYPASNAAPAPGRPLQCKLTVGASNDPLEGEADRAADQVMRTSAADLSAAPAMPRLSRKCAACEEEDRRLQTAPAGNAEQADRPEAPGIVHEVLRSGGQGLAATERAFMEPRFGHDFSRVRVHTDAPAARSARAVGARAYAVGNDIVFGAGEFAPATAAGRRLIAHELAHVVQQTGGGHATPVTPMLQRQPADGEMAVPAPAPVATPPTQSAGENLEQKPSPGDDSGSGQVDRLVFSCADMRVRVESGTTATIYTLKECSLPLGSYDPKVSVKDHDFKLDFSSEMSSEQNFHFIFEVKPGQPDPAKLLAGQPSVHVDVVEHLPPHQTPPPPAPETVPKDACIIHLQDRQLVAPGSASRALFKPMSFERTIWTQAIPLGEFGFVEVDANASGSLTGRLSGNYGPGMLSDICLTHQISDTPSSAPITNPLLGPDSRTDVDTYVIGGRARFRLPASAQAVITALGKLTVAGKYLDLIEVAAVEGTLDARGAASLRGHIDAQVEIIARFTRAAATMHPLGSPLSLTIKTSSLDKIDLAAKIALQGHASLAFDLNASVAARLLKFELWRHTWRLHKEAGLGLGWAGGISYSPNPGVHWMLGAIGDLEGLDGLLDDDDENEDADADVDDEDLLGTLLNQTSGQVTTPDGLSPQNPIPFSWRKPIEFYPASLAIPNAEEPQTLDRDAGPTRVRYPTNRSSTTEDIGVRRGNWPFQGKRFRYFPYDEREEPEQTRLRGLLDKLGYDRSGTDIDHVHELQFGGADKFNNLWPADNSANRSAGSRHRSQLAAEEQQLGNLAGRHFVIAEIGI